MFQSIYYGKISKEETEKLLENYGKEGSFLARDSASVPGALCLCVRRASFVHTYRISWSSEGWAIQATPQVKHRGFRTVDQLIDCCRGVAPDGMAPLLHPLERALLGRRSSERAYLEM
ncbi:hypothetical protein AAFF_G00395300 [Aldrovandia affinis]|uniref:SH2 domain-containing protein n=1 Tax=Aldrovandia affinis TaxID=143900 RepID=A0AAD7R476_9TELE|nr:hypothetical protein AAFF_G00395300 [Aldrovandia affinis]